MEEKPVPVNRFQEDGRIIYAQSVNGIRACGGNYEVLEDRNAYTCSFSPGWLLAGDAPDAGAARPPVRQPGARGMLYRKPGRTYIVL